MLSVCLTSIHFISGSEGPGRLDHEHLMSGLYNQVAAGQRPESASSASPPSNQPVHFPTFPTTSGGAGMLVVPQPINASKVRMSVCEVTVHHITTTCHLPPLHTYHLYGQPAMFLTCNISTFIVYISDVWLSSIQMGGMGGDTGLGFSHHHVNGGPRKYQCKMCPQVGIFSSLVSRLSLSL